MKRTGEGDWKSADQKAFLAATVSGRVRIWVHGYGISEDFAYGVGMSAYRRIVAADEPPLKFVIWSWPGDRERHRLRDIRRKGVRTNVEGYYLGWLMAHLDAKTDVSISGYSYGARIVSGGLHVLGGGELYGLQLPRELRSAAGSRAYRAVLLAPAIDNHWLAADEYHGMALSQTSSMLSIYSSCDSVLKWYRFAVCDRNAQALGYAGISSLPPRTGDEHKFSQVDVCCNGIGSEHDWQVYLDSGAVTSAAREVLCRTSAK